MKAVWLSVGTARSISHSAYKPAARVLRRRLELDCRVPLDASPQEASDQGDHKQHDRHPK